MSDIELILLVHKIILSIGRNKGLLNIHKELGYTVDEKPSYEISKKII